MKQLFTIVAILVSTLCSEPDDGIDNEPCDPQDYCQRLVGA
jgi:hypothetical protein